MKYRTLDEAEGREAIHPADYRYYEPNRLVGVPPLVPSGQAETRPTAEVWRLPPQLTPEQPTVSLHLCAYCNNPVPNGKFVHQSCEDRHDEREEQADRESGYSAE